MTIEIIRQNIIKAIKRSTIFPPYIKEMMLVNAIHHPTNFPIRVPSDYKALIHSAFVWDQTPQGGDFWYRLYLEQTRTPIKIRKTINEI